MATLYLKSAGGLWSAAGSWSTTSAGGVDNSGPPLASTDVILELLSGALTIDSGAVCRSINLNSGTGGYNNTITHSAVVTLTIGDATAGAGNKALDFSGAGGSFLYNAGNVSTSILAFVSTSAIQQAVNFSAITVGGTVNFTGAGGSWKLTGALTINGSLTHTNGSLDFNGQTIVLAVQGFTSSGTNTRSLTLGAASITISNSPKNWDVSSTTGLTFSGASSAINMGGGGSVFAGGGFTYGTVNLTGLTSSAFSITGANTFATLSAASSATKTGSISISASQTITGTLTLAGQSTINRLLVLSGTLGTPFTLTAAVVAVTYADFQDITGAGAGNWNLSAVTGLSGDCGGNSGITFTTPAAQNATVGGVKNWSDATIWTSRVPLPQDDITSTSWSSGTLGADMPRLGKSIDFSGATAGRSLSVSTGATLYGSLNLTRITSLSLSASGIIFSGRGSYTLTSASNAFGTGGVVVSMFGGTLTLQDSATFSSGLTLNNGFLNFNNQTVSISNFSSSNSNIRALTLGSGTITLSGNGTVWTTTIATGMTLTANTSTIKITPVGAGNVTFFGGGLTYNNLWWARGVSTGANIISDSNTFNDLKDDGTVAHILQFTAGTTTTVSTFTVSGNGGNITINSNNTAIHTLVKTGGGTISCNNLNIQHSVATPNATWYAGNQSVNNQSVATTGSGWIFSYPPAPTAPFSYPKTCLWGNVKPPAGSQVDWSDSINVGLVGCWLFNEGAGRTLNDIARLGQATLTSLSSPDITTSGWRPRKFGTSVALDGTDDYAVALRKFGTITGKFSIECWVIDDSSAATLASTSHRIISWYDGTNNVQLCFDSGGVNTGIRQLGLKNDAANSLPQVDTGTYDVPLGLRHVVATFDGTNYKIYVDGVDRSSSGGGGQINFSSSDSTNVYFGQRMNATGFLIGGIDHIRIFNRALLPNEVKRFYAEPFAGIVPQRRRVVGGADTATPVRFSVPIKKRPWGSIKPPVGSVVDWGDPISAGLVGCWLFNEGGGTIVNNIGTGGLRNTGTFSTANAILDTTWTTGKYGKSLNHTSAHTQNGILLRSGIVTGTTFTYVGWAYVTAVTGGLYNNLFTSTSSSGLWITNGKMTFFYGADHLNSTATTANTWTMFAVTVQGGNVTFYFNGKADGTATGAPSFTADGMLCDSSAAEQLVGGMSHCRFYNRALQAGEIQRLYLEPFAGIIPNRRRIVGGPSAGGGSILTGSGSSTFTFSSTGTGLADAIASASSSFTFSPLGIGKADGQASGLSSFTMTPTGVGKADAQTSGSSLFNINTSGVGKADFAGSGSSTFNFTTTGIGLANASGSGASSFSFTPTAISFAFAQGSGASTFTFTPSGVGKADAQTSGSSSFTFSLSGVGKADAIGSALSNFTYTTSGIGKADATGSGASNFSFTVSSASGTGTGSCSFSITVSGIGKADAQASGSSTANFSGAGIGKADAQTSGSSNFSFNLIGVGFAFAIGHGNSSFTCNVSGVGAADAKGSGSSSLSFIASGIFGGFSIGAGSSSFNFASSGSGKADASGSGNSLFSYTSIAVGFGTATGSGLSNFNFATQGICFGETVGSGLSTFSFTVISLSALNYSIGEVLYWDNSVDTLYWDNSIETLYWNDDTNVLYWSL